MEETLIKKIQRCEELLNEGFDKDYIIKALEIDQLNQKEAGTILKALDGMITEGELADQERSYYLAYKFIGAFIAGIGLLITIGSYLNSKESYILAYGAILSGAYIFKVGYQKSKQTARTHSEKNSIFSRSRFRR